VNESVRMGAQLCSGVEDLMTPCGIRTTLHRALALLALALSPSIADAFGIPDNNSGFRIAGFRTSLANGFAASVRPRSLLWHAAPAPIR
jgi:hypothetical protein